MANFDELSIQGGALNATDYSDKIEVNGANILDAKLTVKAGKGDDNIDVSNYNGKLYVYAGLGSDTISASAGNNYLYGESGTNTFILDDAIQNTIISAGKGKAIIDLSAFSNVNALFFSDGQHFTKVKNDLEITLGTDKKATIKDFYKLRGEYIVKYAGGEFDLRNLHIQTDLSTLTSANYTGTRLVETVFGDSRNNVIKGGDGDDNLYGGDGNDTIYGDGGNDYIDGGAGNDKIYGKKGHNTINYSGGDDIIYLEKDAQNTVQFNGYTVTNKIKKGNDLVLIFSKDDVETGSITMKNFFKINSTIKFTPPEEIIFEVSGKGRINGSIYNDHIIGSASNDTIYTQGGEDLVEAGLGNDKIYSNGATPDVVFNKGDGNDTLSGQFGNLKFSDVDLTTLVYERVKNNLVIQYSDTDSVTLLNYFKDDKTTIANIEGADGISKPFADVLGANQKTYTFKYGDGDVKIYPLIGAANNILNLEGAGFNFANATVKKSGNNLIFSNFSMEPKDKITLIDYFKTGDKINGRIHINGRFTETLSGLMKLDVNMTSTKYNGNLFDEQVFDTSGNDTIKTKDGFDRITLSAGGNDIVYCGSGNDVVIAINGDNKIYGDAGDDELTGGAGIDKIYGGVGNDDIDAGDGDDIVDGGSGNDTINGEAGNDTIKGGAGNDTINGGAGDNLIYGGAGNDIITIDNAEGKVEGDLVKAQAGNDTINIMVAGNTVYGDAGHDTIIASSNSNYINGGAGNDNITINKSHNFVDGGSGNDIIQINSDYCEVNAGAGNDTITLRCSNTKVQGGAGNDTYYIMNGGNTVADSAGNDMYYVRFMADSSQTYNIEDTKGKDTLRFNTYSRSEIVLKEFDVSVDLATGKIVNYADDSVVFSAEGGAGYVDLGNYFGKNCIERIETNDDYYITKAEMQNLQQEIAAWLVENNCASVDQYLAENSMSNISESAELMAFVENINWQK
ncbi:hypothetical protein IKU74_03085 [bacterium]|nr:hypothetical protein [bacterium]